MQDLGATATPTTIPGCGEARPSLHQPRHNWGRGPCRVGKASLGSLQEASFLAQEPAESFPDHRTAPAYHQKRPRESLSETAPPKHFAFEEKTRHKLYPEHPPTQLRDMMLQLGYVTETLQKVVRKLAELTLGEVPPTLGAELAADGCKQNNNNDDDNNNNTTTNHHQQQQQ